MQGMREKETYSAVQNKTKPCTRTEPEKGVSNAERVRSVLNRDKERERERERERGTCKKCANQKREKKSRRCPSLSVVHKTVQLQPTDSTFDP